MVVLVPAEPFPVISSSTPPRTSRTLQPIKLLSQREQYTTCHIQVPDESERMAAIALNGKYYSFFRRCHQIPKALGLMMKLVGRGDAVAVTSTRQGYVIWLHEPDAIAPAARRSDAILPNLEPADCWVISDRQPQYRSCNLRVPDLPDTIPGLTDGQRCYSLYRREQDGDAALKLAARLTQRGDEVIVVVAGQGYTLCVREPSATPVA